MTIFIGLLLLAICGAPLFAVIAASAMLGFHTEDIDLAVMTVEIYRLAETPILLAIPLFTFAGYLLGESDAPRRLVRMSEVLLAGLPGGLALVAIVTCALFTAFTGASGVTIVAMGALLYPALLQAGYKKEFSLGLLTSSGSLGILFAPSLPLILYAVVVQQLGASIEIDALFLAGILPGTVMLLLLSVWCVWQAPKKETSHALSWQEFRAACRDALPEMPLPIVVLGGIYSGFLAVSEAAAVTAAYVLFVEVIWRREVPFRELPRIMRESMLLVGGILLILGVSLASTNYVIDAQIPAQVFEWISGYIENKWSFLLALNVFLLVLGMVLDIFSALVIMIPIILPVAMAYGIDPVHLGIIFLANMQLGYFTPPVGMNLFIASYCFKQPIDELFKAAWPFFLILLMAVLLITYWPALSLALL